MAKRRWWQLPATWRRYWRPVAFVLRWVGPMALVVLSWKSFSVATDAPSLPSGADSVRLGFAVDRPGVSLSIREELDDGVLSMVFNSSVPSAVYVIGLLDPALPLSSGSEVLGAGAPECADPELGSSFCAGTVTKLTLDGRYSVSVRFYLDSEDYEDSGGGAHLLRVPSLGCYGTDGPQLQCPEGRISNQVIISRDVPVEDLSAISLDEWGESGVPSDLLLTEFHVYEESASTTDDALGTMLFSGGYALQWEVPSERASANRWLLVSGALVGVAAAELVVLLRRIRLWPDEKSPSRATTVRVRRHVKARALTRWPPPTGSPHDPPGA